MAKEKQQRLKEIAKKARGSAQEFAEMWDFCPETLKYACAHAARILFEMLENEGYSPKFGIYLGDNEGHVFIEVDDFILDITATQYGNYSEVVVWPISWGREAFHEATRYAENLLELIQILKEAKWGSFQVPEYNE